MEDNWILCTDELPSRENFDENDVFPITWRPNKHKYLRFIDLSSFDFSNKTWVNEPKNAYLYGRDYEIIAWAEPFDPYRGAAKSEKALKQIKQITEEIRDWFEENAPTATAVVGIYGKRDSCIVAALLARALGPDRVLGVIMSGRQADLDDSYKVIQDLGIKKVSVSTASAKLALVNEIEENATYVSEEAEDNLVSRLRMAALYAVAQSLPNGGIVINTCNKLEDYIGYNTKYGDCAGDISILGNLLISEIIDIGNALNEIPNDFVNRRSDEDDFGFNYSDLENYMNTGTTGNTELNTKIRAMYIRSRHKFEPMFTCLKNNSGD